MSGAAAEPDLLELLAILDRRIQAVLGVLGPRWTVSVNRHGISVRGLIRDRSVRWEKVRAVVLVHRSELIKDHALEGIVGSGLAKLPFPIPGLGWMVRKVLDAIWHRLPGRPADQLAQVAGTALAGIRRRGNDVELSGLLALVSFLSEGLTAVVVSEARARGITVETDFE